MKKAFTLIELLVVIAIIAILAAMLMPALQRARTEAQQTDCRYKVRQMHIGFDLFRTDHDGLFVAWVGRRSANYGGDDGFIDELRNDAYWNPPASDQSADAQHRRAKAKYAAPTGGDPYYQLVSKGYVEEAALMDCPSADNVTRGDWYGPEVMPVDNPWDGRYEMVRFPDYGYDVGRVSKNSAAGRAYYGDCWQRSFPWSASWGWWNYNHPDGANVAFIDGGVEWCDKTAPDYTWAFNTHWCNWYRKGCITNPRMDEDSNRLKLYQSVRPDVTELDLIYPRDNDDIYACEGSSVWGSMWNGLSGGNGPWCYAGNPKDPTGNGQTRNLWGNSAMPPEPGGSELNRNYVYYGDPSGNRSRYYPEVGPFADEGRWDTHDCRILPINWRLPSCYTSADNPG